MTNYKRNDEEQFIFSRMVEGDKEAFRFFMAKVFFNNLKKIQNETYIS